MKVAILYTAHRQFRELDYFPEMFRRAPKLQESAHVIFHCNNSKIPETALREKLSKIPSLGIEIIYSPQKNEGGYPYGQFEAISDAWDKFAGRYDWVIHLHPDVFIIDEDLLMAALQKAEGENVDLMATPIFGLNHPSFATDFFAFRPAKVPRSLFESYRAFEEADVVVPLENLFYVEIHRAGVAYSVVHRFKHGHYHRDIDLLGLWHEHQLSRIAFYFKQPWRRWGVTGFRCICRPYRTTRFILTWLGRKTKGVEQDSLAQQLTAL